jgi:hypothetical protein
MRGLRWDKNEMLISLGVDLEIDPDETYRFYEIVREGLILRISLWEYHNIVHLLLSSEVSKKEILSVHVLVRGTIRNKNEKWGDFVIMEDCSVVSDVDCISDLDESKDLANKNLDINVEIAVNPNIRISFV